MLGTLIGLYIIVVTILIIYLDSLKHQFNIKYSGWKIIRWSSKYKKSKILAKRIENCVSWLETLIPYSNWDWVIPQNKTFLDLLLEEYD